MKSFEKAELLSDPGWVSVAQSELLTLPEVAVQCGVSERTMWRMQRRGDMPPRIRDGRALLYKKSDVAEWLRCRKSNETASVRAEGSNSCPR